MSEYDEAKQSLDAHKDVCTERYGNLWASIRDLKEAIQDTKDMIRTHNATTDVRLTAFSNRLWSLVVGGGAASVVALGSVIFFLLTRGLK